MKFRGPIVITGFMACGKTQVARALARRLNLTAIDLDNKIATRYGRTAAQLIVDEVAVGRSMATRPFATDVVEWT